MFQPMLGLISYAAGVTGSVGITRHARITQVAGLNLQSRRAQVVEDMFMCIYVHVLIRRIMVDVQLRIRECGSTLLWLVGVTSRCGR